VRLRTPPASTFIRHGKYAEPARCLNFRSLYVLMFAHKVLMFAHKVLMFAHKVRAGAIMIAWHEATGPALIR
jgi:hypothetical protein